MLWPKIIPSGVNSFFSSVCWKPAPGNTNLVLPSIRPAPCAVFMKIGRSANSSEEKIRSGLAAFSAATCEVRSSVPTFGHCSATFFASTPNFFSSASKAAKLLRP